MAGNRQEFTYAINADTSKAKKQIADLFKSLDKVQKFSIDNFDIAPDLVNASRAAEELTTHLRAATNVNTGQLNLAKFNKSIRDANTSLGDLISDLSLGGSAGQSAFEQMTAAIARTQVPLRQTNALLKDMATTLKNTIKWELSSTAVHGLESALGGAVSYAKNLNTSLTNIRIVTGQSVEDMARFTKEANAAAKALSTTTKAYADASLIYYQQGDSQELAAKKAAITIKAANSSFETSAKEMSEYLTSVWNSYQVGADELERYVDIMANLGAKTATSLEEIATSMQKVAATSNTVGVSMEQVSSIIATVSSVTRESAESIGTSYKTIFARIGDLKLGKVDEDGVGLGQVSSQLDAIGIKILDESGNLREMGDIIMDLGTKWQTMNQAQKTAVAQVVAGKRQYTQLMALFENWDMFQANMNIAKNSEGALQNMADIYAESWEAASARVQASLESIFSTLINDQGLIKLTNFTASFVDGIGSAIDSIGGLNGVLRLTGSILLKTFSKEAGSRIKEIGLSIKNMFVDPKKSHQNALNETRAELSSLDLNKAQINAQIDLIDAKNQLLAVEEYLTSAQKQGAQAALQGLEAQANKVKQVEDEYLELKRAMDSSQFSAQENYDKDIRNKIKSQNIFGDIKSIKAPEIQTLDSIVQAYKRIKTAQELVTTSSLKLDPSNLNDYKDKTRELQKEAQNLKYAIEELGVSINSISVEELQNLIDKDNWSTDDIKKLSNAFMELGNNATADAGKMKSALEKLSKEIEALGAEATPTKQKLDALLQSLEQSDDPQILARSIQELTDEVIRLKRATDGFKDGMNPDKLGFSRLTEAVFDLGGGALDLINGGAAVGELIANWGDEATTTAQKMGSLLSSMMELGMGGVSIFQGLSALGMSNPWSAGIAIGVTALSAISGVASGNKQKDIEEARSAQEKYRESGFKISESTREEIQANQDLLSSYSQLLSVYDETKTNQAELIESAYALADAYEIVGGKALIAAGEYGEFNKQLLQAQKAQAANNISDFDNSMYEIQQSVNENTGGYYDIQSQNLYGNFEKEFIKTLSTDQRYTYTMESAGLKLNAAWAENTKIGGWGGRSDQVFANLYETFKQDAYQAILNPEGLMSIEEAAIQGIEKFVQTNAKADFKFDDKNLNALYYSSSPDAIGGFYGYEKFQEQFINAFQDVNDLKVSEAYNVFNTSGILREDNITQFLKAEDLGISEGILDAKYFDQFEGLIDSDTQGISWNKLDFDGKLNQYQKYRDEVVPAIKKKQSEVQAEMTKHAKDSNAYKALVEYYEYLNTALNDIELITGADSEIGKTFELYLSDKKARDIERAKAKNIENFLKDDNGQYRTSKNTTLSDFMSERVALEESLLQDAETYDTLAPYVENGQIIEQYRKEYNAAVNDIIAGMVQGTDLTNLFDIDTIIKESVKPKNQTKVTSVLVKKGIETADEVNGLLLQVISGTWDESAQLLAESIIDANKQEKKTDQAVAEYEQFTAAGKLFKSGMSSQDRTDFSNVFFNGETSKEEIDRFINMSFEERETYIESIIKEKEQNMISELDAAAKADAAVFEAAKTRAENARLNLGLESGEIDNLLAGYIWNDDKQGYYSAKNPEEAYAGKLADRQNELHEYDNYVSQMKTAEQESILSYGEWQMAKVAIEDTLSAMEKLQVQQSKLAVDLSNLPKQGTAAWRRLRGEILKTGKDLNNLSSSEQIEAISQAQIDNLDEQIKAKRLEYFDTESEAKRAEISQAIADLQDQKDQIAAEVGAAYTKLNDEAVAGIAVQWERANKDAEKQQQMASILSSSVNTGIISNEEAAIVGITAAEWAGYATEVRAAKAATQSFVANISTIENLEKEKNAISGAIDYFNMYKDVWKDSILNDNAFETAINSAFEAGDFGQGDEAIAKMKEFRKAREEAIAQVGDGNADLVLSEMANILSIDKNELINQINQVTAAGKDSIIEIYSSLSDELQSQAQEAVKRWEDAFKTISNAKKLLLEGGNLLEMLGDPQEFLTLLQSSQYKTPEEFFNAAKRGEITYEDLQKPVVNEADLYGQYIKSPELVDLYSDTISGVLDPELKDLSFFEISDIYRALGFTSIGNIQEPDGTIREYYQGKNGDLVSLDAVEQIFIEAVKPLLEFGKIDYEGKTADQIAALMSMNAPDLLEILKYSNLSAQETTQQEENTIAVREATEINQTEYDKQIRLQEALDAARAVKKDNGDWEDIDSKSRSILEANGITGLEQVDNAAIQCASALASLAEAAYNAAKSEAEAKGYSQNEAGEWGIQHTATMTEEEGRNLYGGDWDQYKIGLTDLGNGSYQYNTNFEVVDEINDPMQDANERMKDLKGSMEDLPTDLWEEEMESFGLDPDEVDDLGDSIQEMATSSDELANSLQDDAKAADEVAKELQRFDKAVESVKDNYKEWNKALKSDNIQKINKATKEMDEAFSDMLDLDYGSLSKKFLTNAENLELMREAAEGSEEAYNKLRDIAEDDLLIQAGIKVDDTQAWDAINNLQNIVHNSIDDIEIGANIDDTNAIAAMNRLINAAGMTAEQATNYLASMGVDAEVEQVSVPETQTYAGAIATVEPEYFSWELPAEAGGSGNGFVPSIIYTDQPMPVEGTKMATALRVTSAKKSSGGGFKINQSSAGGSGGKGGGGGSKQKETKKKVRGRDEIQRYHKQNDTISRLASSLDKIDKLKNRAYGKDHLAQLDAETNALEKQLAAQQALHDEARKWMAADKADLAKYGAEYDENGTISNYETVMERIIDEYNSAIERYNNSEQGDGDKLALEAAEQIFEDAKKAIENYEEALSIANDSANEMLEIQNQLSEIEVEKITYELELKVDLNERDLELLKYYQDKYAEELDKQDEIYNTILGSMLEYEDNLKALGEAYEELNNKRALGLITEADYAEAIQDLQDQVIDNLSELNDIQNQLVDTYTETLALAREEVEKTTDTIDSANAALQSYMDILALSGKETDYEKLATFYEMMNENNLTKIEIQRNHLDALLEEEDKFQEKIRSGQQLTDLEQEQYQALQEEIFETRDALLSTTQEALDTIRATYENTINSISDNLDNFMAGAAGSMAYLQEQYGYFQEEQERYVSTAKELYEVSKLNRDIENTLGETTSKAAKEALKALQEKINKQSELNELTEYDIEMNQLQYQLLLARIKLEEAQNAKDVVRLTRDENGNYAYRYTANQDKIDEAAQNYEDVLQQINDSTVQRTSEIEQQLLNTMSNYKEKFQEIATDYTLTEEERLMKLEELNNNFAETMQFIQEQNTIATDNLTANQEAIAEHYGVNMSQITASTAGNVNETIQSMIDKTQDYINAMNEAIFGEEGGQTAWQKYLAGVGDITEAADVAYGTMIEDAEEMGEMNEWSAERAQEVINTLTDTLEPLEALTNAWNSHNAILEATISNYESLAEVIQGVLAAVGEIPNTTGTGSADGTQPPKFAKGGPVSYTGLAWVDGTPSDPEYVLNPGDTQNILTAAATVKSLDSGFIGTLIESVKNTAQAMMNIFSNAYHAVSGVHTTSTSLDQNVHITAEFPNVTDHNEIEEALLSLTNRASQFANSKK